MEIQSMLPGYLDILFRGRNKAYGGYELRVNYPQRARNGALYAFLGTALVLAWLMLPGKETSKKINSIINDPVLLVHLENVTKPPLLETSNTDAHASAKPQRVHTNAVTEPIIVANNTPDPKLLTPVTQVNAQPAVTAGSGADVPAGSGTDVGVGSGTGLGMGIGKVDDKPFEYVEQMPEFAGNINSYLAANIHYPEAAHDAGITGKIIIKFIVNEDGAISGAEVVRSVGGGCDEEALRVIKNMPRWKPGKQNGRPVKVYFMLPVVFVLQ